MININEIKERFQFFLDLCKKESETKRYSDATKHTKSLIFDGYIETLREISFQTIRGKHIFDQFLGIRFIDSYIESCVGIFFLIEQGFINLAKRELRFLLESVLKHKYLDQIMMNDSFEDKMKKYDEILPKSSMEFVKDFKHYIACDNVSFFASSQSIYRELCAFTHASKKQMEHKINKSKRGEYLGHTAAKEIEEVNKLIFRTLELCLVCHYNACGPSTTGDLFILSHDTDSSWKFHKSDFIKAISDSYNYKAERQAKKV
jgi:hypothetical protein